MSIDSYAGVDDIVNTVAGSVSELSDPDIYPLLILELGPFLIIFTSILTNCQSTGARLTPDLHLLSSVPAGSYTCGSRAGLGRGRQCS